MTETHVHPGRETAGRSASGAVQPIVPGFHPDPTVCRVGDDYYLAASSFEYFPGAPIFHSTDLVTWTQIGNILDRRNQLERGAGGPSSGVYAGTLRHRDGVFWFITTNASAFDKGQLIVHAADPAGPWSEPVHVSDAIGIDPDIAWDDEGTCYLTWHDLDFTSGGKGILQAPVDLTTGELLDVPYPVWQGSGMVAAEGPHLYQIDGFWYLMLAEGGTERGHAVTIARAPHPRGPYEACPHNPILTHRSTGHAVQNVGHADLVQAPDGRWAAVYLGVRVGGSTPQFHVLGRETFLAGVDWTDGWPQFDEARFDVPLTDTAFHDDFSADALHPQWVASGGEPEAIAQPDPRGGLRMRGADAAGAGALCLRVRDLGWSARARVDGAVGLRVRIDDRHWYGVVSDGRSVRAIARIGDLEQQLGSVPAGAASTVLGVDAVEPDAPTAVGAGVGPDDIVLSAMVDDALVVLARLDGRYLSTEVASGFTGRVLGLVPGAEDGRVLSFTYTPTDRQDADE